jgi:PPK2 family polyphosphate:nucleotide phosphotransferase
MLNFSMDAEKFIVKKKIRLSDFDPDYCGGLDKDKTKCKTDLAATRICELQDLLYANSDHALLLIFQGLDASGKDGCGRRVLEHVNPLGVETTSFKAPSSEERAHDFLWRVHKAMPRYGFIGVFNRSHYEAVLIERVNKIVPEKIWRKRYEQIVDFERMLEENNVVVLKFFLYVSKKEQAERFKERLKNPCKNWKFSRDDLAVRKSWDDYMEAYEDMLNATSQKSAPWHIVPADRKWVRDYIVTAAVVRALEELKMKWPKPTEDLSKIKIV